MKLPFNLVPSTAHHTHEIPLQVRYGPQNKEGQYVTEDGATLVRRTEDSWVPVTAGAQTAGPAEEYGLSWQGGDVSPLTDQPQVKWLPSQRFEGAQVQDKGIATGEVGVQLENSGGTIEVGYAAQEEAHDLLPWARGPIENPPESYTVNLPLREQNGVLMAGEYILVERVPEGHYGSKIIVVDPQSPKAEGHKNYGLWSDSNGNGYIEPHEATELFGNHKSAFKIVDHWGGGRLGAIFEPRSVEVKNQQLSIEWENTQTMDWIYMGHEKQPLFDGRNPPS